MQKFPPSADTIKIIETRDSIIYRDTTVFIHLPGEVKIDSVKVPCPDLPPAYVPDTVRAETPLAYSYAYLANTGRLRLYLVQKDTTIHQRLENAIKESFYWRSEYEKITVKPEPVKYIPKLYKIALWILIGQIAAFILYFVIKLKI